MAHHEDKHCPRCGGGFECRVGSILQCQCAGLTFTDQEKEYIAQNYSDCLCRHCLLQIKHEQHTRNTQQVLDKILSPIGKQMGSKK